MPTGPASTAPQQVSFLNRVAQATKGLTIANPSGGDLTAATAQLLTTAYDILAPLTAAVVGSVAPRILTQITTDTYFSQFAESVAITSSSTSSLAVSTPYVGGEARLHPGPGKQLEQLERLRLQRGHLQREHRGGRPRSGADPAERRFRRRARGHLHQVPGRAEPIRGGGERAQPIRLVPAHGLHRRRRALHLAVQPMQLVGEAQTTSSNFGASFKASFDGIGGGGAYQSASKMSTSSSGTIARAPRVHRDRRHRGGLQRL